MNKKQIEFDSLKREADNNQRLYDMVLKRLKDTELSGMLRTSNARILDSARPLLSPVRPKVRSSLFFGFLLAIVGSLGLAFLLEQLDNTVNSQRDVEERIGLPFLGFVPRLPPTKGQSEEDHELFVYRHPKSNVAEACRAIRTNLLFMTPDRPLRRMLVTSSGPSEGKTTTVINTGITMAQSGSRVLLVDTDMRRPRLHKAFGVANELGVSSVIVGEGDINSGCSRVLRSRISSSFLAGRFPLILRSSSMLRPSRILSTRPRDRLIESYSIVRRSMPSRTHSFFQRRLTEC